MHRPPTTNILARFLEKLEARAPLDAADRNALLSVPHTVKELRRHEFIVREEETPRDCCILLWICHAP